MDQDTLDAISFFIAENINKQHPSSGINGDQVINIAVLQEYLQTLVKQ